MARRGTSRRSRSNQARRPRAPPHRAAQPQPLDSLHLAPPIPSGRQSSTTFVDGYPIEIENAMNIHVPQKDVEAEWVFTPRSKKRQKNEAAWKKKQLKLQRRDYHSCDCSRGCGSKLSDEDVKAIRDHFFDFRLYDDQQKFLYGLVQRKPSQLRVNANEEVDASGRRRRAVYTYHLPSASSGQHISVCNVMFMNVFSMNKSRLEKLRNEKTVGLLSPRSDGRGKHDNRPTKLQETHRNLIIDHVVDVIRTHDQRSHFRRKHAKGTIYIPHTLSIQILWQTFICRHQRDYEYQFIQFENNDIDEITVEPMVTLRTFTDFFNNCFGFLKFRLPKTDECGDCLTLKLHIEALKRKNTNSVIITMVQQDLSKHEEDGQRGYDEMRLNCEQAKASRIQHPDDSALQIDCIIIDFMKTFDCPNLVVKEVRFKDQLPVHCFDVYDAFTDRHHFYCWGEYAGATGANEVISVLNHHIFNVRESLCCGALLIWADNCAGQNKHQFMCGWAHELSDPSSQYSRYRRVDLKFPVKGHTFLICDRAFSVVERHAKGVRVMIPSEFTTAVKKAFRSFQYVELVKREVFKSWKSHLGSRYSILSRKCLYPHGGETIQFSKIAHANFGECGGVQHSGEMWFRYSLDPNEVWRKVKIIKAGGALGPLDQCYESKRKLDPIKQDSLYSYRRLMDEKYHYYYPPADSEELKIAQAAQKAKRDARRVQVQEGMDLQEAIIEELGADLERVELIEDDRSG